MKRILVLLIAVSVCLLANSQTRLLDSIKNEIKKHPQRDTARVSIIMDYAIAAVNENTTELLPYLKEIIAICKEQKYNAGLQSAYMTAQIYYADRGDFSNAMLFADSAFIYLKSDTSKKAAISTAYLHNNIAGDYLKMGDYDQSVFHYTQAAQILEKANPK